MPSLTIRPEFWQEVSPETQALLTNTIVAGMNSTTPANALAAAATSIAVTIAERCDPADWGPLVYDMTMHLQTLLLQEMGVRMQQSTAMPAEPAEPAAADMPAAPAEGAVDLPPVPDKFSGGVGHLPGSRT
jgi:hypothetical protein